MACTRRQESSCRFRRAEGVRGRSYEGSGIGLALVQELARLHGGDVRVESAVGRGTVFTVSVPFGNAHPPEDRLETPSRLASSAPCAEAYVQEARGWLGSPGEPEALLGPSRPFAQPPPALGAPPRGRVLLADDNADMRAYVRRLLEGKYSVEAVENGDLALEAARARPPDLVLSDAMMPGLDGLGLLRALKADARTAHVPVILLSARAGEGATVEGIDAGADGYVTKPFGARELVARVDGTVRLARERAERARLLQERADFEQHLIGIVSHDLRNPLGVVTMSARLLRDVPGLGEGQRKLVDRIASAARRAADLTSDLRDFTKVRLGGGFAIALTSFDFHDLVRDMVEESRSTRPGRTVSFDAEGDGRGVWDRGRMAQLLGNLLSNALHYSPAGTPVVVTARGLADELRLEVHNAGAPIPPDVLPQIFEPLRRGADAAPGGAGLGPYIVKHIVAAHRGTVSVTSTARAGTTFGVRLPRAPPAAREASL